MAITGPFDQIVLRSSNFGDKGNIPWVGIILHCLGEEDVRACLDILTHSSSEVSCHYFIPTLSARELFLEHPKLFYDRAPQFPDASPVFVFQHEREVSWKRAWHAGESFFSNWNALPGCERSLNSCTLGIEFQSKGYAHGKDVFTFGTFSQAQKSAGIALIKALVHTYSINPRYILGHSDVAWDRYSNSGKWDATLPKTDPGVSFFWKDLEDENLGYLSEMTSGPLPHFAAQTEKILWTQCRLQDLGYVRCPLTGQLCSMTQRAINAFRMHFFTQEWVRPDLGITRDLVRKLLGFSETFLLSSQQIESVCTNYAMSSCEQHQRLVG